MRKLIYEIKDLKGYVLGVGILKNKILTELNKNDYVEVNILTNNNISIPASSKLKPDSSKKGKKIVIKKLKKYFKKKKPDYIICNIDDVKSYLKYFVKDSLYITKQRIYIYSDSKDVDLKDIEKKYLRYTKSVEIINDAILIDTTNYNPNIFKNACYYFVDTLVAIYDFIANVIAS